MKLIVLLVTLILAFGKKTHADSNLNHPIADLFELQVLDSKGCLDAQILGEVLEAVNVSHPRSYKVDTCNLSDPFTRGLAALMMLYKGDFKNFRNGKSAFDDLIVGVRTVHFFDCKGESAAAFTEPDSRVHKDIFLCLPRIKLYDLIFNMSTLIHERVHLESKSTDHIFSLTTKV